MWKLKLCTVSKELVSLVVDPLLCQSVTSLAFCSISYPFLFFLPSLPSAHCFGFFFLCFLPFSFWLFFLFPSPFLLSSFSYFRTRRCGSLLFPCQHFNPHQRSHQLKPVSVFTQKPPPKFSDVVMKGSDTFSFWEEGEKWEREKGVTARESLT